MDAWRDSVRGFVRDVLQAAFRLVPWPTETGLRASGSPGPTSPVIVTGNYDLTVRRVLRALRGVDAWVVVASSGGINVWCAAAGGHLTNHQVVMALKTSGIESRVRHRRAILPQLAATGVRSHEVVRRSGWKVHFGPVYAEDLPAYLAAGRKKTDAMRHVRFGFAERLAMAAAWAAPAAILIALGTLLLRPAWTLPMIGLCVGLSLAVFLAYDLLPAPRRPVFAAAAAAAALGCALAAGAGTSALVTAGTAAVALSLVLTFDYSGSTPIEGGSHFEERRWQISLDLERCKGAYLCWEVCPEACFDKRDGLRKIDLAHDERCIRCGACIVQCPFDALSFEDQDGRRIEPESIRRFKLNLLGQRSVQAAGEEHRPLPS